MNFRGKMYNFLNERDSEIILMHKLVEWVGTKQDNAKKSDQAIYRLWRIVTDAYLLRKRSVCFEHAN